MSLPDDTRPPGRSAPPGATSWPRRWCRPASRSFPAGLLVCAMILTESAWCAATTPAPEVSIAGSWDSQYVSEGHDNLDGQGLASATAAVGWADFGFSAWYGTAAGADYRELNLSAGYQIELGKAQIGLSYTRLEFRADGVRSSDNELSAALVVPMPGAIEAELSAVYSSEAEGGYVAARAWGSWEARGGAATITAFAAGSIDFGYVSATFDGANHLEAGLEVEVHFSRHVSAAAYVSHALALANLERSGYEDITWGGLRLTASF